MLIFQKRRSDTGEHCNMMEFTSLQKAIDCAGIDQCKLEQMHIPTEEKLYQLWPINYDAKKQLNDLWLKLLYTQKLDRDN